MKLVIGLGNPGEDYKNTRHNIGYIVIDELQKTNLPKKLIIRKTDTFMNESGVFVKKQIENLKLKSDTEGGYSNLYIIHDDLDIRLGEFKIQFGRGPKDHNGIKSVDQELNTDQYWHIRVGIDNRPMDARPMGEEYVLQNFTDEERKVVNNTIKEVCRELLNKI